MRGIANRGFVTDPAAKPERALAKAGVGKVRGRLILRLRVALPDSVPGTVTLSRLWAFAF